ncbi:hypothetical protein, partial [Thermogutta sp.]|uniref:hypothetical protein n=1 Tax=Thermogutta sp. TaxID=1962930 RepID=UPI0025E0B594
VASLRGSCQGTFLRHDGTRYLGREVVQAEGVGQGEWQTHREPPAFCPKWDDLIGWVNVRADQLASCLRMNWTWG